VFAVKRRIRKRKDLLSRLRLSHLRPALGPSGYPDNESRDATGEKKRLARMGYAAEATSFLNPGLRGSGAMGMRKQCRVVCGLVDEVLHERRRHGLHYDSSRCLICALMLLVVMAPAISVNILSATCRVWLLALQVR
jgi:hypothetical protein